MLLNCGLEKTLESPLDCKEIEPVNPKRNQLWIFIGGLMLKLKLQYFGHIIQRVESLEKTLMLEKSLDDSCESLEVFLEDIHGNALSEYEWQLLSLVRLFASPWTVACQAPLSMGFSRQEYWSGLPFPSPGKTPWAHIIITQGKQLLSVKVSAVVLWEYPPIIKEVQVCFGTHGSSFHSHWSSNNQFPLEGP